MKKHLLISCLIIFCGASLFSQEGKDIRFAFLTDIHVSPGAPSEDALKEIIAEVNSDGFDFLILTGDLTNTGSDAELQAVKNALQALTIPYFVISGNHETNRSESAGGFTGVIIGLFASANGKLSNAKAYYDWFDYQSR